MSIQQKLREAVTGLTHGRLLNIPSTDSIIGYEYCLNKFVTGFNITEGSGFTTFGLLQPAKYPILPGLFVDEFGPIFGIDKVKGAINDQLLRKRVIKAVVEEAFQKPEHYYVDREGAGMRSVWTQYTAVMDGVWQRSLEWDQRLGDGFMLNAVAVKVLIEYQMRRDVEKNLEITGSDEVEKVVGWYIDAENRPVAFYVRDFTHHSAVIGAVEQDVLNSLRPVFNRQAWEQTGGLMAAYTETVDIEHVIAVQRNTLLIDLHTKQGTIVLVGDHGRDLISRIKGIHYNYVPCGDVGKATECSATSLRSGDQWLRPYRVLHTDSHDYISIHYTSTDLNREWSLCVASPRAGRPPEVSGAIFQCKEDVDNGQRVRAIARDKHVEVTKGVKAQLRRLLNWG